MKQSEYYKDILEYIEIRLNLISTIETAKNEKDYHKKQLYLKMLEQRQEELNKWLNKEV